MQGQTNETPADPKAQTTDAIYLAAVGGLLVVISGALAVLWWVERSRRVTAESEADQLRARLARYEQFERAGGPSLLSLAKALPATQGALEPVQRQTLAVQTVEYAGQTRQVLLVPAEAGRRLGFEVGDLVLVCEPPKRAPPPAPATRPAANPARESTDAGNAGDEKTGGPP